MNNGNGTNDTKTGRLPIIQYEALNPEQKAVYDVISSGPRGKVEGPLAIWVMNPTLADNLQRLGTYCRFGSSLPPRLSELAIISVGAFWKSEFEWCAHAPIAEEAGIAHSIIEALRQQNMPKFIQSDEAAIYHFVRSILEEHQVNETVYQNLIHEVGQAAVIDLVGIVGYYCLVCMTLNVFRVPLPQNCSAIFDGPQLTS